MDYDDSEERWTERMFNFYNDVEQQVKDRETIEAMKFESFLDTLEAQGE